MNNAALALNLSYARPYHYQLITVTIAQVAKAAPARMITRAVNASRLLNPNICVPRLVARHWRLGHQSADRPAGKVSRMLRSLLTTYELRGTLWRSRAQFIVVDLFRRLPRVNWRWVGWDLVTPAGLNRHSQTSSLS